MQYIFRIPFLPPSENKMYWVDRKRQRHLTEEAKKFKTDAKLFMPPMEIPEQVKVDFDVELHGNWYTKKGRFKIKDGQNMMKALIDAIAEKAGCNDCCLWNWAGHKIQSKEECMRISIKLQEDFEHTTIFHKELS